MQPTKDDSRYHFAALLIAAFVGVLALGFAPYENGTGMAAIVVKWVPLLIAFSAVLVYMLFRRFAPRLALLPTVLGVGLIIWVVIGAYF